MKIHLVGIGGVGLSAIARVLQGQGYCVSGSDQQASVLTSALAAEGISISIGHNAANIRRLRRHSEPQQALVLASSAIPDHNVELVKARELGIPVVRRKHLLGELTAGKTTIAVAGTHGKTTTAAMIAWILVQAGLEPTFIVGGIMQSLGTNARAGAGPHFVIEADEYDHAFLSLRPDIAVVTTIEHDHPDCFPTLDTVKQAFVDFTDGIADGGRLVVCDDDQGASWLGAHFADTRLQLQGADGLPYTVTYGLGSQCEWQANQVQLQGSPTFKVRHGNRCLGTCALQLPGEHNVVNALASLAAASHVGVGFGTASTALTRFQGTARRFEVKGQAAGVTVIDDYAHHPTEIRATLAAARCRYPGQTLWAVFQPHTYSRTAALMDDFAVAFGEADHVLVTSTFAARERNGGGSSAQDLADRIRAQKGAAQGEAHAPHVEYIASLDGAVTLLLERVRRGAVVITLGAGDGYIIGERLLDHLKPAEEQSPADWENALGKPAVGAGGEVSALDRW